MSLLPILKILAALATAATGLLAFIKPGATYGFTGLNANGVRGVSEIRASVRRLTSSPWALHRCSSAAEAYRMLGIGYLGIAAARAFSIVFDKSTAQSNLISLAIEIVFGVILVI